MIFSIKVLLNYINGRLDTIGKNPEFKDIEVEISKMKHTGGW